MAVTYLINDLLSFSPDARSLKNIKVNKLTYLHAPASQCLLALIERQGEVICQEALYKIGWGEIKGPVTSPSAYYQCFVNLRKQLKRIGYEDELVITVPKEGMKLEPTARVTVVKEGLATSLVSPVIEKTGKRAVTRWLKTNRTLTALIVLISLVLLGLASVSFLRPDYATDRFSNVKGLPECLYLSKTDNISTGDAVKSIQSHNISCSEDRPVYVSVSYGRLTSIACDSELKQCRSVTEMAEHE